MIIKLQVLFTLGMLLAKYSNTNYCLNLLMRVSLFFFFSMTINYIYEIKKSNIKRH